MSYNMYGFKSRDRIKRILRGDLKPYMGRNVKHMTLSFDTFELRMEDA